MAIRYRLKPCPFCGQPVLGTGLWDREYVGVWCDCGAAMLVEFVVLPADLAATNENCEAAKAKAAEYWNRRVAIAQTSDGG